MNAIREDLQRKSRRPPGNLAILGSTGSIGQQSLDVVRANPGKFRVLSLAANSNVELVVQQIEEFAPKFVAMADLEAAELVRQRVGSRCLVEGGEKAVEKAATLEEVHTAVGAIVGFAGLKPVFSAIEKGIHVALANKESVVAGGDLLRKALSGSSSMIVPVDSEHSGVYQCLFGRGKTSLRRIILTASGGPFFRSEKSELEKMTPEQALKHPRWEMGAKNTIDSATLMNKGLEVLEAAVLFDLSADMIEVLIHPQSLVHALAEYHDGTQLVSVFETDMRVPISYALGHLRSENPSAEPCLEAIENGVSVIDLVTKESLEFYHPDMSKFPALALCYRALRSGGAMPVVLNAANEVAVGLFLEGSIKFTQIPELVEGVMDRFPGEKLENVEDIIRVDAWARLEASKQCH